MKCMKKKIKLDLQGDMEFLMELKSYLYGYKSCNEDIEALIQKDLENPEKWVPEGLDQKFPG